MTNEKVNYRQSHKKQIIYIVALFIALILLIIGMYPIDTNQKTIAFTLLLTILLCVGWLSLRKVKE